MDASDNKSTTADIMAAVLSNMNKELPVNNSSTANATTGAANKELATLLNDADLDDLMDGEGSEKKDESTEKKGTNTSNETAGSSSCRDDSDVDIYVSASNKLIGYRYTVEEMLEIATSECCKRRPELLANDSECKGILRAPPSGSRAGSSENVTLGRNNTPMDSNGPLLTRMGNAGATSGRPPAFNANRNGSRGGFRGGDQEIILSPQIRSFNMGCQLPPASVPAFPSAGSGPNSVSTGPGGLLGDSAGNGANDGSTAAAGRRIGSGRLMSREERLGGAWNSDYKSGGGGGGGGSGRDGGDGYGDLDGDYSHRGRGGMGNNGPGGMNKPNSRFYRMNDRRDDQDQGGHRGGGFNSYRNNNYGDNGDRGDRGGRGGGYNRNHRYEQEEPEWFTGGPCSQLDTIELHGFDGPGASEGKGGDDGAGRTKFKRINDVEKEMKLNKEDADQANERRRRNKNQEEATAAATTTNVKRASGNNGNNRAQGNEEGQGENGSRKEAFAPFGPQDEEEESALRKMVPPGSSPIKKAGGQMDMRHLEDFLRLEDLLNSDDFEDAAGKFEGDGGNKRRGQTSRFQQWFKSTDDQQQNAATASSGQNEGKIAESVLNFMQQSAKGGSGGPAQAQSESADPNPVPRPPSSTSGTSEIMSVKDLEASMQKKASTQQQHQPNQSQFAQGPKIFGTGRLMNRIPNLMDQQVALQNQQKEQQQGNQHPMHGLGQPHQQPIQSNGGGGPEDMFAFQNFLAQIAKSGGGGGGAGGAGQPPMPGLPGMMPGKPMPPPQQQQQQPQQPPAGGRMWNAEEANNAGTPPILKMMMHQQQQQFIQENLNRQQQALAAAALVKAAQAQAALRLSPNVGGLLPGVSPPKRIPSPRELQQHTQTIMQSALIRKKLQEQSENFRRRQEQLQQQQQQQMSGKPQSEGQPKMASPTPAALAFTPTSVLRKMTAHGTVHGGSAAGGGNAGNANMGGGVSPPNVGHGMVDIKIPTPQQGTVGGIVINNGEDLLRLKQSSMAGSGQGKCWSPPLPQMVGGGPQGPPQARMNSNNIPLNSNGMPKPMGRPIVKGGGMDGGNGAGGGPGAALNEYHMQQLHQQMLIQQQQQQRQAIDNQKMQQLFQQLQQRNNMMSSGEQRPFPPQQQQQQVNAVFGNHMGPQQQQQNAGLSFMAGREGNLSPTSNQLARWFSPELLAKAQAGKLPSMNQPQAMMSLEEFERTMSSGPIGGGGGGGGGSGAQPPIGIKRN